MHHPCEPRNPHWPKITIITPSFNQGCYLEETIASVLNQNYPNLEYMIFDGGSQDNSVEIIKKYESCISYWESAPDKGQANALNKGFRRATGDIIGWLNSDDIYLCGALHAVASEFLARDISFLYGGCMFFYENQRHLDMVRLPRHRITDYLPAFDYIDQPSSFWTRGVMDEIGLLDEDMHYAFDWDYFIKIYKKYPLFCSDAVLSGYRIHATHKTGTGGEKRRKEILSIIERHASPDWLDVYQDTMRLQDKCSGITRRLWRLTKTKTGNKLANKIKRAHVSRFLERHDRLKLKVATAMLDTRSIPPT